MIDLTAKSGDWRWAGAMAYAGHQVRRVDFAHGISIGLSDGKWRYRSGNYASTIGEIAEDREYDWELWQGPKPVESERVRWPIVKRFGGFQVRKPSGDWCGTDWIRDGNTTTDGYRFFAWVCRLPDGTEQSFGAGLCPVYWSETFHCVYTTPTTVPNAITIWPSEVEMVKVGGAE